MRVIAGGLGGRLFEGPNNRHTHPMGDRMRGGLFNTLGDIVGLDVLDAFAGSGALSFEAASRGAASVIAIERDREAQKQIAVNIEALDLENQVKLVKASANAWLVSNETAQFDLVFCDPPYDDLQLKLLERLTACVKPGGIYVLSWPGKMTAPEFVGLTPIATRSYGDIQILFWRA